MYNYRCFKLAKMVGTLYIDFIFLLVCKFINCFLFVEAKQHINILKKMFSEEWEITP
jgi:hypothetical protein